MVKLSQNTGLILDGLFDKGLNIQGDFFDRIGRGIVNLTERTLSNHRMKGVLPIIIFSPDSLHFSN
jgi:hypothetical protein